MKNITKTYNKISIPIVLSLIFIIFAGCDKEVSRSPVEPPAPRGFIHITSIPKGFNIFQDGKNTGRKTPDSISYIEAGEYEITLKKKYFKDTSVVIILSEDEKFDLDIDIISNPSMYGNLFLQTLPEDASISINDSVLNKFTPQSIENLLPGEYKVRFSLLNYRDTEITAIVQSSQTNNYIEELRDTSEWVDYQVFNSGIQTNSLTAVTVDNMGVKWIGTLDAGLIKYDGVSFTNYNTGNSSLPGNKVNCISVDELNNIWIGTDDGIGLFDGNNWVVYNRNNSGLTSELINIIYFDGFGNVWIGTAGNLVKFDGINWVVYNEPLGRDWIQGIYMESQNKIWLGTRTNGIFIFENETFSEFSKLQYNYPTFSITSLTVDQAFNLWFCFNTDTSGRNAISFWDGSIFNSFYPGFPEDNLNHIYIDNMNNKWISSSAGLLNYDAQNFLINYTIENSLLSSNRITASVRDNNGIVWITTIGGGLNKFKPPR